MSGAVVSRMDDGTDYRGWDLWVEKNRIGSHIISKWPDDALKVVTEEEVPVDRWTHVFISYDGSKKASGVMVAINGEAKKVRVAAERSVDRSGRKCR